MTRGIKQLIYGAGFLVFFSGIIYGVYAATFRAMPTCSDTRQNGNETGIDCGGGCVPCAQKYAQEIGTDSIVKFAAGGERTVVVAYLKNPNDDVGFRDVVYTITATNGRGETVATASDRIFMYDRSSKIGRYVVATLDVALSDIADMKIAFSSPQLVGKEEFVEPRVNIKRSATDVVGVKTLTEPSYVFTKDLAVNATGDDVKKLEDFLYKKQFLRQFADGVFDTDTKVALTEYQKAKKITPANGSFNAKTRAQVNAEMERITRIVAEPNGSVSINGNVKNDDLAAARKIVITGLLYDTMGVQLGGSKTELSDMESTDERTFKILFPKDIPLERIDATRTRLFVDAIK